MPQHIDHASIGTRDTIRARCSQQHAESDWSQENPSHRHGPSRPPYPAKDTGKRTPRKIYCRERYRHIYRVITVSQVSCPIDQSPAVHTSHPMTKVVNAKPENQQVQIPQGTNNTRMPIPRPVVVVPQKLHRSGVRKSTDLLVKSYKR